MGTKSNPGPFDCYARAEPDEPMFILLARDPMAPTLVRHWAAAADQRGEADKSREAFECAIFMETWRREREAKPKGLTEADVKEIEREVHRHSFQFTTGSCTADGCPVRTHGQPMEIATRIHVINVAIVETAKRLGEKKGLQS